jgi:sulfide:quinone oxidoreductase
MKDLLILGGGTAGTITANGARKHLDDTWRITVVDPKETHLYQPGLLFLPFGDSEAADLVRARADTLHDGITWVARAVDRVDPEACTVALEGGDTLPYDLLVIASGAEVHPEMTPGLTGLGWKESAFEFYTLPGAEALREAIARFEGGRFVLNVVETPIKCPVAPLEMLFLADEHFTKRGIRDKVELVYATPLDAAFTKPVAAAALGELLKKKGIHLETEFAAAEVDGEKRILKSYDEREVPYDLLVSIPIHGGAEFVTRSGLGDESAYVHADPRTLRAKGHERIFVLGDAGAYPTSKAGSVAHFQAESFLENLPHIVRGEEPTPLFDGHANCFVETGHGKALLIDFNYDVEPLTGSYPLPGIGPFSLLAESRTNHWGKLAFKWIYWNGLLPNRPMPVPMQMSMAGKNVPVVHP